MELTPATTAATDTTNRRRFTRRGFLKWAGGIGLVSGAGVSGYYATRDCVRLGLVGAGARGNELASRIRNIGHYMYRYGRIVAVVDVNLHRAEALRDNYASSADVHSDHRDILQRPDIDAVIVTCPDHWHAAIAIDAMKAGKAVYLEKPMTRTIHESYEVVRVAKETNSRILVGTQQRNDVRFRTAAELAMNGRLGKIAKVQIVLGVKHLAAGPFPDSPVPDGLDWDRFLGPSPTVDFMRQRYEGWRDFWDYGGGELTNWGIHHIDCALWSVGLDNTLPVSARGTSPDLPAMPGGYECPEHFECRLGYPDGSEVEILTKEMKSRNDSGFTLIGDKAQVFVSRTKLLGDPVLDLAVNPLPTNAKRMHSHKATMQLTTENHLCHFWDVVRGEAEPVSSVESCHHANVAVHIANIAVRVGKPLKWDPAVGAFPGDTAATALANPPRRKGYELNI